MRVGSLFTGIGGFDLGLERAGHRIVFQCEKDEYRRRVLKRHWPGVPCWQDVVHLRESAERGSANGVREAANGRRRETGARLPSRVDLLCGGFPCQDLSVAGRRAGLQGERSSLFFEFARIADDLLGSGGWMLIENVPGLLSSNRGRDFAVLLAAVAELGFHDLAWRVLDSRYFGVPQRRRRVFILARRARGRRASEVLLEPESGGGDFEAGREAGKGSAGSAGDSVAKPLGAKDPSQGGYRNDLDHETYIPDLVAGIPTHAGPVTRRYGKGINTTADDEAAVVSTPPHPDRMRAPSGVPGRVDGGLVANPDVEGIGPHSPHLDPKPDGPRYAACGDAVTVNVAYWIGKRLMQHLRHQNDHPIRQTLAGPSG